jgi:hypothetical protein
MQPTPLRAEQDRAFLKAGFGPTVFPIKWCAAAQAQAVRRQLPSPTTYTVQLNLKFPRLSPKLLHDDECLSALERLYVIDMFQSTLVSRTL